MTKIINSIFSADTTIVDIGTEATRDNFFGYTCIGNLVSNLVSAGLLVSGVIFFAYLVWGGVDYLNSGGDKGKIDGAQKRISSALIGLTIVASSWAIYQIVLVFFGIDVDKICSANPVG